MLIMRYSNEIPAYYTSHPPFDSFSRIAIATIGPTALAIQYGEEGLISRGPLQTVHHNVYDILGYSRLFFAQPTSRLYTTRYVVGLKSSFPVL